jgi:hypothetical protein
MGVLLGFIACDDGPGKSWLVERTRILGARVSAENEPARASIAPGETARVDWLVAFPGAPPPLAWSFAACVAREGTFATPRCDGVVLASGSGRTIGPEQPRMSVTLAGGGVIGEATRELLVIAAFCEDTAALLDARTFTATCPGGSEPLLGTATVRLTAAGPNKNPEIAPDAIRLDGVVLPDAVISPSGAPCTPAPDRPIAAAGGGERHLAFRFRGDEREAGEVLALSHVVTAGELDRQRSSLEPEDSTPRDVTLPWTPPPIDQVGEGGRLVELFFVLRDGRGGTALARRTICVRRPE